MIQVQAERFGHVSLILFIVTMLSSQSFGGTMFVLSNEQLVQDLASPDPATADRAVIIIMQRRETSMFKALLSLEGNVEFFSGKALLNPRASVVLPLPTAGFQVPESQRFRIVTVEAAALYLICALERGTLHFAQAPLLIDPRIPPAQSVAANTPERLHRGFVAAEQWLEKNGIEDSKHDNPIGSSLLRWL